MNSLIVLIILFGHYYSSKSSPGIDEDQQNEREQHAQFPHINNGEAAECTRLMGNNDPPLTDKEEFIRLFSLHPSVNDEIKYKVIRKINNYPNGMVFYDTTLMECLNLQNSPPNCRELWCPCL
ncbi:uncharacterized protein LOC126907420 [Daktulosphaira vitifoliae]|uniref:uncharacterized protein LOC126907420 n=1 Tax=Daktulosphaira vitifoliae TaxID=58002 RepID=UPI0021AA3DC6|nr:uncharacterized protein LOC126907420 [Daktulosphaira vitifoliae]